MAGRRDQTANSCSICWATARALFAVVWYQRSRSAISSVQADRRRVSNISDPACLTRVGIIASSGRVAVRVAVRRELLADACLIEIDDSSRVAARQVAIGLCQHHAAATCGQHDGVVALRQLVGSLSTLAFAKPGFAFLFEDVAESRRPCAFRSRDRYRGISRCR